MLLVWHYQLIDQYLEFLRSIDRRAVYWPRSSIDHLDYTYEWWISFSSSQSGLVWVMRFPQYSEIIYRE